MILIMKAVQILFNAISIIALLTIDSIIDMQIIFGITLLLNSSISIATIFYDKASKVDKTMSVFNTFLIFMIAQVYTAITGIFSCNSWMGVLYKAAYFCLNAIMMGVTFDAFKKFNEKNKD